MKVSIGASVSVNVSLKACQILVLSSYDWGMWKQGSWTQTALGINMNFKDLHRGITSPFQFNRHPLLALVKVKVSDSEGISHQRCLLRKCWHPQARAQLKARCNFCAVPQQSGVLPVPFFFFSIESDRALLAGMEDTRLYTLNITWWPTRGYTTWRANVSW